jgi:hypothetical protein
MKNKRRIHCAEFKARIALEALKGLKTRTLVGNSHVSLTNFIAGNRFSLRFLNSRTVLPRGALKLLGDGPHLFPFRLPALKESALSATRHEAVEKSDADGIIETKAKVDTTGFTLLGFIGWGAVTAAVEGQGVKIAPSAIHKSRVIVSKEQSSA